MTETTYFDPSELRAIAETIDPTEVVETSDYFDDFIIPIGTYLTQSREIRKVTKKADGSVTVEIALTSGVETMGNGGVTYGVGKFPLRSWLSSKLFEQEGRPGKTSGLAQYLKAAHIDTKGKSVGEMLELLPETLQTAMKVRIEWQDKGVKQTDGTYSNANLKSKDFLVGKTAEGEATYHPIVVKNGVEYKAQHRVGSFSEIR